MKYSGPTAFMTSRESMEAAAEAVYLVNGATLRGPAGGAGTRAELRSRSAPTISVLALL